MLCACDDARAKALAESSNRNGQITSDDLYIAAFDSKGRQIAHGSNPSHAGSTDTVARIAASGAAIGILASTGTHTSAHSAPRFRRQHYRRPQRRINSPVGTLLPVRTSAPGISSLDIVPGFAFSRFFRISVSPVDQIKSANRACVFVSNL